MISAMAQLVPLALAAALSSVPLTVIMLILLSQQRTRSGPSFLIGWVAGMAVVAVAGVLAVGVLPGPGPKPPPRVLGTAEIVVGAGLLGYALISGLRSRHRRARANRWFGRVSTLTPLPAFGLALVLNLRPKALLLAAAAGLAITNADRPGADTVILVVTYVVVAVSTVAVPVLVTLLAPAGTERVLVRIRDGLDRHGAVITAAVVGTVGLVIVVSGLSKLLAA